MKSNIVRAYHWLAELVMPAIWIGVLLLVCFVLLTKLDNLFDGSGWALWDGNEWVMGAKGWQMLASRYGVITFGSIFLIGWVVGICGCLISYERSAGREYRRELRRAETEKSEARQWAERRVRDSLDYEFRQADEIQRRAKTTIKHSAEQVEAMQRELGAAQMRAEIAEARGSGEAAKTRKTNNLAGATERHKRRDRRNRQDGDDDDGFNPNPSR